METPAPKDFGKRRPAPVQTGSPPVKRSRHVALLLTGTLAVGGSAYAMMPRNTCEPNSPGMAAPSASATACAPRTSSSGGGGHGGSGGWWSRSGFYGGNSATSSGTTTSSGSSETTRGGFGGFARSFAAHFSGG
jgi:hypothetical protein